MIPNIAKIESFSSEMEYIKLYIVLGPDVRADRQKIVVFFIIGYCLGRS